MSPEKEISAFDAKTHLSELLREAERGRSFIIRRRGKAVARLVPAGHVAGISTVSDLVQACHDFRQKSVGTVDVTALVKEGRRR